MTKNDSTGVMVLVGVTLAVCELQIKSDLADQEKTEDQNRDKFPLDDFLASCLKYFDIFKNITLNIYQQQSKTEKQKITDELLALTVSMDLTDEEAAVAKTLIDHSIDTNSVKFSGATPIQLAALYGRETLVSALLEKGANPFLEREIGYTAYQLAEARKHTGIAELLKQKMNDLIQREEDAISEEQKLGMCIRKGNRRLQNLIFQMTNSSWSSCSHPRSNAGQRTLEKRSARREE
jgi:ankyrin repeat protein